MCDHVVDVAKEDQPSFPIRTGLPTAELTESTTTSVARIPKFYSRFVPRGTGGS